MKMIYCKHCTDIVLLREGKRRTCDCGKSWGEYLDDGLNARIGGDAIPVGFGNRSFVYALSKRPEYGQGKTFEAFVIPKNCPTISYENEKGTS